MQTMGIDGALMDEGEARLIAPHGGRLVDLRVGGEAVAELKAYASRLPSLQLSDRDAVARQVFGTLDERHPLVRELRRWGPLNVAGRLRVLQLPPRYDFRELRLTP